MTIILVVVVLMIMTGDDDCYTGGGGNKLNRLTSAYLYVKYTSLISSQ